jgi:hypothetical protein
MTGNMPASLTPRPSKASSIAASSLLCEHAARCERMGVRLIITSPKSSTAVAGSIARFTQRTIDPTAHAYWDAAYLRFRRADYARRKINLDGGSILPHDAASWRILAVDTKDTVVGTVTCRVFDGELVLHYLNAVGLLQSAGEEGVTRWGKAFFGFIDQARQERRIVCEASHWAIIRPLRGSPVGVSLMFALGAMLEAFTPFRMFGLANWNSGASDLLARLGGVPLTDEQGVPMAFHHSVYNSTLKFLWMDSENLDLRYRVGPADIPSPLRSVTISEI